MDTLTAAALLAIGGNASNFASGREMADSSGLTPKQNSSGGAERLLGVSKRVHLSEQFACAWSQRGHPNRTSDDRSIENMGNLHNPRYGALLHKSAGAPDCEPEVSSRHECPSKIEVSDDQLETLRLGTEGTWLLAHLARQGQVLKRKYQRQPGPPPEVRRGDIVPLDDQGLVRPGFAPGDGHNAKPAQACWPEVAGARIQYRQPASEASSGDDRRATVNNRITPPVRQYGDHDAGRRRERSKSMGQTTVASGATRSILALTRPCGKSRLWN